jgi:hypothetical protein
MNTLTTRQVPTPGTGNYFEDFTTMTYLDSGPTNAHGWGNGTITNPRTYIGQQLGFYATSDPVRSVEVQGRKAYIGVTANPGSQSLQILDLTDPSNIVQLSNRDAPTRTYDVHVEGDILYVGSNLLGGGDGDLFLYNVSNPYTIPAPIDYVWDLAGFPVGLDVQGHFLFVAAKNPGGNFLIYDVEDPANIREVFSWGYAHLMDFHVVGELAYLAHSTYGMKICNISNPYTTFIQSSVNTPGNATSVLVDGTLAYIADGPSGVQIVDVSNPNSPSIIGSYDTAGNAHNLAKQGHTLFVADGSNGLVILDVADPTHPILVEHVWPMPYTWDVDLYGGDVVVATDNGVITLRIGNNLAALPFIGSYDTYEVWDVRVRGDVAYVAAGPDGFLTLDVSNPSNPILLDQYNLNANHFRKLDVQGHFAYVIDSASSGGEFYIFDVLDPSNIQPVWIGTGTNLMDCFAFGEVIFYTWASGFGALNVSNPYSAFVMWTSNTGTNMTACWVQGYNLYIVSQVSSGTGLFIYDIIDLNAPNLVYAWTSVSTNQYDIFVEGDSAYIVDAAGGGFSEHWNITNPYNPYYSDYVNSNTGLPMGVWAFGPYMLTANYTGGVALWNTSDINDIQYLGGFAPANRAIQLTVAGDYVYVANRTSLVILRLFRSAGSTYSPGPCQARSLEIDATDQLIENATLTYTGYVPPGTYINFELSPDGGSHWESVTPGVEHTFTHTGHDLRWRVFPNTDVDDRSVHLYSVNIDYEYNELPTAPVLNDPGTTDDDGIFPVSWSTSTDDGSIDHYILEMSDSATFTTILNTWTPTTTSVDVTVTTDGTYHFRVRAIDDDGEASPWSNDESIDATVPILPPPPIPGFPIEAIALGTILAVGVGLVSRRRKQPKP